jgi:hypothetical protein
MASRRLTEARANAAQVLAERGDCREAYDSPDAVAALAGLSPVTKESGKHRGVHFRWACNTRFRVAVTTVAGNSRHASPRAAAVYPDATARGHDHQHAIRILARAWTRVIYRCWRPSVVCPVIVEQGSYPTERLVGRCNLHDCCGHGISLPDVTSQGVCGELS